MTMNKPTDIDSYIKDYPKNVQDIMQELRSVIKKAAPEAEEKIGYGIPTFTLKGNLVHFGGFKNHVGLYPGAAGIESFKDELAAYEISKGTVRFPIDKPIPFDVITKIVKYRVKQNLEKASIKERKTLRTCPQGHQYYKSSDCPTCPTCEQQLRPQEGFLSQVAAPARHALENKGITTLQQLAAFSEAEILALHGMGPGSMPKLRKALEAESLSFKTTK